MLDKAEALDFWGNVRNSYRFGISCEFRYAESSSYLTQVAWNSYVYE